MSSDTPDQQTKVYHAVAHSFRDNGIDTIFGLMGEANFKFSTYFSRQLGGSFVGTVIEGGAVGMADGYSRVTDRLGVVAVSHGAAVTNSLTALTEAVRARSRVLLLTGDTQTKRDDRQWLDLRAVAHLTGAEYRRIRVPEAVAEEIAAAADRVLTARIPVVLDIPYDLMDLAATYTRVPFGRGGGQRPAPDPDALDRALGIVASARRPIVLAGRGAARSGARDELVELAGLLGAPVATTLLGRNLFDGHPLNLGIFGTQSHPQALDAISQADCVIAFGAGLNLHTTVDRALLTGKAVVHCDVDAAHLGRFVAPDAAVLGDARTTAGAMIEALRAAEHVPSSFGSPELVRRLASRDPADDFVDQSTDVTLDMRTAMIQLDRLLPADRAVITDGGRFEFAVWPYLHVTDPLAFAHTVHFGAVGLGTGVGLGAAYGRRDRPTVAVVGDVGGAMALMELITAVRYRLPLVLVILNDGANGAYHQKLVRLGEDPSPSLLSWPEFADVAKSLGAQGVSVRTLADLAAAAELVKDGATPLLIDVKCDPTVELVY